MVQNAVASKIQERNLVPDIVVSAREGVGLCHQRSVISQEYCGRLKKARAV
jgi:hypothetical protein